MKDLRKLIEKQQKEIEELTTNQLDIKDKCIEIAKKLEENRKTFVAEYILAQVGTCPVWECGEPYCNYISKQKIKDKIKQYNQRIAEMHPASDIVEIEELEDKIKTLQELLEE